jgi:hypothetical protein
MTWWANLIVWLGLVGLLFCGCYFLMSHFGIMVTHAAPKARLLVQIGSAIFSLMLAPVLLLLAAWFFRDR